MIATITPTDWAGLFAILIMLVIFTSYWRAHRRVCNLRKDESFWIRKTEAPCDNKTKVSIIIPARDEENNIGPCVEHALAQTHKNIEVIVLDDNSSDNTSQILEQFNDPRLKVIHGGEEPPKGWRGKPWACQRAASQATGQWLMFIDADVRIAAQTVAATVGYCERHAYQYLTGMDKHIMRSFGERCMHAHFLFNLGFQRDWHAVNDPDSPESVGNGRFMIFRADTYAQIGGFKPVAHKVLEDEAFGKLIKEKKIPYHINSLIDLVEVRMYTSTGEVLQGWVKTVSGAILDGNQGKSLGWPKAGLASALLTVKFLLWDSFIYLATALALLSYLPLWILPVSLAVIILDHSNRWLFAKTLGLNPVTNLGYHLPGLLMALPLYLFSIYKATAGTASWKGRQL